MLETSVHVFETFNGAEIWSADEEKLFIRLFEIAFKMMKNGVYFMHLGGLPMGNWLAELFPGLGFWHWVLPWGWEFDIAKTSFGQKAVPRGGNSTFSRCSGVGNFTLVLVKMLNFPGSARPPSLGLNIDKCIILIALLVAELFKILIYAN